MIATVTSYSTDDFAQLLGFEPSGTPELIGAVRRGLPYNVFERVQDTLGVSAQTLAVLIGLPVRTLNKRKHEGCFSSEEFRQPPAHRTSREQDFRLFRQSRGSARLA